MKKWLLLMLVIVGLLLSTAALAEVTLLPAEEIPNWDPARTGETVARVAHEDCVEAVDGLASGDILATETLNCMIPLSAMQEANKKGVMVGGRVAYETDKFGYHCFYQVDENELLAHFPGAQTNELYIGIYGYTLSGEEADAYRADYEARGLSAPEALYEIGFAYIWEKDGALSIVYPETSANPMCIYTMDYHDLEQSKDYYTRRYVRAWNGDFCRSYGSLGVDKETGILAVESTYRFGCGVEGNTSLAPMPYTDVAGHAYAESIEWAYNAGLLVNWTTEGATFAPDDSISFDNILSTIMAYNLVPPVDVSDVARREQLIAGDSFAESLYQSEDASVLGGYLANFPQSLRDELISENAAYTPGLFESRGWVSRIAYAYYLWNEAPGYEAISAEEIDERLAGIADAEALTEAERAAAAFCLQHGVLAVDETGELRLEDKMTRAEFLEAVRALEQLQNIRYTQLYSTDAIEYIFY